MRRFRWNSGKIQIFVAAMNLAAAACGGGGSPTSPPPPPPPPETPPHVSSVVVTPADTQLTVGNQTVLAARGTDSAGVTRSTAVSWNSGDTLVAKIDAAGKVTAVGTGITTIYATVEGVTGQGRVQVRPLPGLAQLNITAHRDSLLVGESSRLQAEALDSAGAIRDVPAVRWSTSNPAVAVVDSLGFVTLLGAGAVSITASQGSLTTSTTLTGVPFTKVAVGNNSICAMTSVGKVYCRYNGSAHASDSLPGGLRFRRISAGSFHTCGIAMDRSVYCWGEDFFGSTGDSLGGSVKIPSRVRVAGAFVDVAAGVVHSCAVAETGSVYCWGANPQGSLGGGDTTSVDRVPVLVKSSVSFVSVASGYNSTCAISSANTAYCWGYNIRGELGTGDYVFRPFPAASGGGLRWSTQSMGLGFGCGLDLGGLAYCWGSNSEGQLGAGGTVWSTAPVAVSGGLHFTGISSSPGGGSNCAIATNGDAYCWGTNRYGQLGDGTRTGRSSPTKVAGGFRFVSIGISDYELSNFQGHACGATTGGQVVCWGTDDGSDGGAFSSGSTTPLGVTMRW